MNTQEKIQQKNDEIEKTAKDFEVVRAQKLAELDALQRECDLRVSKLQLERDMIALEEKLKGYPQKLIKEHTTCTVCGALMRPQQYIENEQIKKAWMCQTAQPNHDLIVVG